MSKKLEEQFEKAAQDVKTLANRPDNESLLKLYANYKQATEGDASGARPGMMNLVARAKYDAWASIKGTSSEDAMKAYVGVVKALLSAK